MDNDYNDLPPEAAKAYQQSPVGGKPLLEQIAYWRDRAKYFETQAYLCAKRVKDLEEQQNDEGEWWKNDD